VIKQFVEDALQKVNREVATLCLCMTSFLCRRWYLATAAHVCTCQSHCSELSSEVQAVSTSEKMGGVWSTSEIGTTRIEYWKGRTLSEIAKFARW